MHDYVEAVHVVRDPSTTESEGIAAREGHLQRVKLLLDAGADPSASGAPWATPVTWAERRGHSEVASMIKER